MKKFLILIFIVCKLSLNIYPQNLLQNSNFESFNLGIYGENPFYDNEIENWYSAQGTPQVINPNNLVYLSVHTGVAAAYLSSRYIQYKDDFSNFCIEGIFQNIEFYENKRYKISFWVRNPSIDNVTLSDFYLVSANGLTNNPNEYCNIPPTYTNSQLIYHGNNLAPGDWQKITTYYTPNKNYSQLWIYPKETVIHYGMSSEFTIDDISIEDVTPNIQGSEIVCNTNSTFYLYNCPANSTVIWSHSNNLIEVQQPPHHNDPYKFIIKASSDYTSDYGWVKAKIIPNSEPYPNPIPSTEKSNITLFVMKTFWIGIPPNFYLNETNELYQGDPGISLIQHDNNWDYLVNSVSWSYSGANLTYLNGNTERADFRAGNETGAGYIYAKAENQSCLPATFCL